MARMTRHIGDTILVVDGVGPARHFWSRWMDRALAPHETEMINRPGPIPANDIEPEGEDEEPSSEDVSTAPEQVLRFD